MGKHCAAVLSSQVQEFRSLLAEMGTSELRAIHALLTCAHALGKLSPVEVRSIQDFLGQVIERRSKDGGRSMIIDGKP